VLRSTAVVAALVFLVVVAHHVGLGVDPRGATLLALAAIAVAPGLAPALRPTSPGRSAAAIDAAHALGERFTTAVAVIGPSLPGARLVVRDTARHASRVDLRRIPHARVGREAWAATIAVAAAAIIWLWPVSPGTGQRRDAESIAAPGGLRPPTAAPARV